MNVKELKKIAVGKSRIIPEIGQFRLTSDKLIQADLEGGIQIKVFTKGLDDDTVLGFEYEDIMGLPADTELRFEISEDRKTAKIGGITIPVEREMEKKDWKEDTVLRLWIIPLAYTIRHGEKEFACISNIPNDVKKMATFTTAKNEVDTNTRLYGLWYDKETQKFYWSDGRILLYKNVEIKSLTKLNNGFIKDNFRLNNEIIKASDISITSSFHVFAYEVESSDESNKQVRTHQLIKLETEDFIKIDIRYQVESHVDYESIVVKDMVDPIAVIDVPKITLPKKYVYITFSLGRDSEISLSDGEKRIVLPKQNNLERSKLDMKISFMSKTIGNLRKLTVNPKICVVDEQVEKPQAVVAGDVKGVVMPIKVME